MMCATVLSEGGYEPTGRTFSVGNNTLHSVTSTTTPTPIISIKINETEPYNRKSVLLKNICVLNTTSNNMQLDLFLLDNDSYLTTPSWSVFDANNSIVLYDHGATSINVAGGVLIESSYINTSGAISFSFEKYLNSPLINSSISGKSKVLCIAGVSLGGTVTTCGSFSWIEII
jgi:hypothetical protein